MVLDIIGCNKCDYEKEMWRDINEVIEIKCDKCDGIMKKIFVSLTFSLKGFGWASKGTATAQLKPTHSTEVGIKVDYSLKEEMRQAGERVD